MADFVTAVLFIAILLTLYVIGVPIAFSIGLTCLLLMLSPLVRYEPQLLIQGTIGGVDSFIILAVPLFLLTGEYMNMYGLTDVIFDFAEEIVGPIKGGIAHVNVVASIIFSGMSGAATADAAGLGTIEYNAMKQRGYRDGFSVAVTGGSSIIGPIIPPSIPLIFYGILSQQSIGTLFIAGVVPGLLLGVALLILCTVYAHLHEYDRGEWWSLSRFLRQLYRAGPALGAPILIIGGILLGYFTATEAGAVAVFYTILVGQLFYGGISTRKFYDVSYDVFVTTGALIFIIAAASLYGFMIRRAQIPQTIGEAMTSLTTDPLLILFLIVFVLLIVGTMMEVLAAITILVPIFLPITQAAGIDPVHFGLIMVLSLMIGLLTPPFGVVLFILERVTGVPLEKIMISIIPFYIPMLVVLLLIILFPELVLGLPRVFGIY